MMITHEYKEDIEPQVVVNGSEFEFFLDFRNKIRSNPELVLKYNQLKLNYQNKSHQDYLNAKSSFINSVLNI